MADVEKRKFAVLNGLFGSCPREYTGYRSAGPRWQSGWMVGSPLCEILDAIPHVTASPLIAQVAVSSEVAPGESARSGAQGRVPLPDEGT